MKNLFKVNMPVFAAWWMKKTTMSIKYVGDTINKTNIIHIWLTVFTPQCYDFCRATGEEFKGF